MAHPSARAARPARNKKTRTTGTDNFTPLAGPVANPAASSDKALLPLGALMLAVSVSGWAQSITPTPSTGATTTTSSTAPEGRSLAPVTVTGTRDRASQTYQSGITSVGKAPLAAKDIPQSLTVVNEKLIHDQGKDSFKSALENVVGITFEAGEGGRIGDNIRLRGFSAAGDIYLDGMRDISQYNRDTFNYDRVEVLRGAASMLFGRGSTGGIINQVSKTPRLITEHEVNTTIGTGNYLRLSGDFNFKTSDDAAFRIGVMTTDWDGRAGKAETHRRGLAADYRWGIGTSDEFMVSLYHLNYNDKPDLGGRWLQNAPAPFSPDKWYGVDSDYQRDSADIVTGTHTHRWADGSTLKTTLRDGHFSRDLWATQINGFAASVTQANFNQNTVVNRGNQTRAGQDRHTFLQSDYVTKTNWFGLKNDLLIGGEYALERSGRDSYSNVPGKPSTTVGIASNAGVADTRVRTWANNFTATTVGIYAQDIISLTQAWKLVGGFRHDSFKGEYDRVTGGRLSRSDNLLSTRLGVMYQPTDEVSYYASYGTSFNTSGDLYQYDATTANTPPEKSRNIEIGAKWELFGGDLSLRTALARTDKYNERSTDTQTVPGGTEFLLSGQRHTNSLEFEVAGRLSASWDVFAGIAFMRGVIDKAGSSPASAASVGQEPGLLPHRQANLWTTYRFSDKWRVGGGLTAVSKNKPALPVPTTNSVPGYTKFDALLEYQINQNNSIKVNLDNVFNKVYYTALYTGWPGPAAPERSLRATWTSKF